MNILTTVRGAQLGARNRIRLIAVGGIVAFGMALIALVVLIPPYVIVRTELHAAELQSSSGALSDDEKAEQTEIATLNTQLAELAPFAATSSAIAAIQAALEEKPSGLSITGITYTAGTDAAGKTAAAPATLLLSGISASRTALSGYQDALKKDPLFSDVTIPISALAGGTGGMFTVTLTGAF